MSGPDVTTSKTSEGKERRRDHPQRPDHPRSRRRSASCCGSRRPAVAVPARCYNAAGQIVLGRVGLVKPARRRRGRPRLRLRHVCHVAGFGGRTSRAWSPAATAVAVNARDRRPCPTDCPRPRDHRDGLGGAFAPSATAGTASSSGRPRARSSPERQEAAAAARCGTRPFPSPSSRQRPHLAAPDPEGAASSRAAPPRKVQPGSGKAASAVRVFPAAVAASEPDKGGRVGPRELLRPRSQRAIFRLHLLDARRQRQRSAR